MIVLKNKELLPTIKFLQQLELPAKDSRHRSKLVTLLVRTFEELHSEELELAKRFDLLDQQGVLKKESECNSSSIICFNKEQSDLMSEEVVIEGGAYIRNLKEIPRILNEYEGMLSGEQATIYNRLLEEYEKEGKT